jgi:hypothetical protein
MTDAQSVNTRIAAPLMDWATPVDRLRTHPENPRRGNLEVIAESLTRFGQLRPILALPDGTIIAGNHTYRAATELLHWTHVAALHVALDENESRAYLLADNRTSELGTMDQERLAELLGHVVAGGGGLGGTGYDDDFVDNLAMEMANVEEELEHQDPTNEHAAGGNPAGATADPTRAPMEQIVLLYDAARAADFRADCELLKTAWGVAGVREVALEAVTRAANQERAT